MPAPLFTLTAADPYVANAAATTYDVFHEVPVRPGELPCLFAIRHPYREGQPAVQVLLTPNKEMGTGRPVEHKGKKFYAAVDVRSWDDCDEEGARWFGYTAEDVAAAKAAIA